MGQSDISPYVHVIGLDLNVNSSVKIKEKLHQFTSSTFESKCQAIMCKKKVRDASIHVIKGRYTIVALDRGVAGGRKVMAKIDVSAFDEVEEIAKDPVVVVAHWGSVLSGHYIVYCKVCVVCEQ